jgi:hypothetical protein
LCGVASWAFGVEHTGGVRDAQGTPPQRRWLPWSAVAAVVAESKKKLDDRCPVAGATRATEALGETLDEGFGRAGHRQTADASVARERDLQLAVRDASGLGLALVD